MVLLVSSKFLWPPNPQNPILDTLRESGLVPLKWTVELAAPDDLRRARATTNHALVTSHLLLVAGEGNGRAKQERKAQTWA